MDELRPSLEKVQYDDQEAHKDIYTHIEQNILRDSPDLRSQAPPLDIVLYTTRSLLHYELDAPSILPLLNLLTHVETERKNIVSLASQALQWNEHYAEHPEDGHILLTLEEESELRKCAQVKKDKANRTFYVKAVRKCCELHIYRLLASPEWPRTLAVFLDYFAPRNSAEDPNARTGPNFLLDLSDEEWRDFKKSGQICFDLIAEAADWTAECEGRPVTLRRTDLQNLTSNHAATFRDAAPAARFGMQGTDLDHDFEANVLCTVDVEELCGSINSFLADVETRAKRMQALFPV